MHAAGIDQAKGKTMRKAERGSQIADQLARRLAPLAIAIGFLIALVPPTIYYVMESRELKSKATYYAQNLSDQLQDFVLESPGLWKYQAQKYLMVLHGFLANKEIAAIHILDESGRPITQFEYSSAEKDRAWGGRYTQAGAAPLVFNNHILGEVQVRVLMHLLLLRTFFFLLLSTVIGISLAWVAYRFPVKTVARLEKEIQDLMHRLHHLSSKLMVVQEEERKRVAMEIHDGLATTLSAIKLSVQSVINDMHLNTATPEPLKKLISTTQLAIDESRRIMNVLHPSTLDALGIVATIKEFCRHHQQIYSSITIARQIEVEEGDVPEAIKGVIFRIMQEAFHNIVRHSKAERVNLSLIKTDNVIEFTVSDNGTGFDLNAELSGNQGLGLISIKERTEGAGGSIIIESVIGVGTIIRSFWPA
jgi:signal transduction histidine kinase